MLRRFLPFVSDGLPWAAFAARDGRADAVQDITAAGLKIAPKWRSRLPGVVGALKWREQAVEQETT